MHDTALYEISLIILLGLMAQWVGWRVHLPAILFLLAAGVIVGPVLGWLNPDELFGNLLTPFVSLSVAIILFEGGLTLRISELKVVGGVVWRLITVGVLITLVLSAIAARFLLNMGWSESILLGAILVVTGPTVVGPMIRQIRPTGAVGPALKWEGIVIDPVGASLAVLVFEALLAGATQAPGIVALGVLKTLAIGLGIGLLAAAFLIFFMRRYLIPDYLENGVALATVVGAFAASNYLQPESGLLTVTVMGVAMANQRYVSVYHLIEFKENLRLLILSTIFVLLAARLNLEQMVAIGWGGAFFLLFLLFVVRPASVFASTWGSKFNFRERLFMSWMAPRGIVAAAIGSVFALQLGEAGYPDAHLIAPVTFLVIGATVLTYGTTADWFAQRLKLSTPNPQGCVFVGAHGFARQIAKTIKSEGFPVVLVDSNWSNITAARQEGLDAYYGDALSEAALDKLELDRMGRLLAMTANSETNALATLHFSEIFPRAELYQLSTGAATSAGREDKERPRHLQGRTLFGKEITYDYLRRRLNNGALFKSTKLTEEFGYLDFLDQYGDTATPLFIISRDGKRLHPVVADKEIEPHAGMKIISLVPPT